MFYLELDNTSSGIADICGSALHQTGTNLSSATFQNVSCCKMSSSGNTYIYYFEKNLYPLTIVLNIARTSTSGHGKIFWLNTQHVRDTAREEGAASITGRDRLMIGYGLPGYGAYGSWYDSIGNNTWYNVIQVCDGTNTKTYVNGVLKQDHNLTSNVKNTYIADIGLGSNYITSNHMNGYIRKFMIFNEARTDIQELYQATKVI